MSGNSLLTTYDGTETMSLAVWRRADYEGDSQERLHQSLQTSPWSSTADPDEMLFDRNETVDNSGWDGTFDDSRQPRVQIGNNAYDEADPTKYSLCDNDHEQVEEDLFGDKSYCGVIQSGLSQAAPELRTPYAPSAQAISEPMKSFEQVGRQSRPEILFQPPSIVVSDSANDKVADRNPRKSSESCSSSPLHMSQMGIKKTAVEHSYRAIATLQRRARLGGLDGNLPTNYELATQDRQPPDILSEIEPQSEVNAAVSLRAFCDDADSTATEATAAFYPDTNLLHVKRPGLTGGHPRFRTAANASESSKNAEIANLRYSSAAQDTSRIFTYLSPSPSVKSSSTYQHSDSACSRENTPIIQATQFCNGPIEPLSPVSPSPSTVPQADDHITRCRECPDTVFKGPNRKNSLQRHQRDHHNGRPRLECLVRDCDATFAPGRKDNRLKHVRALHRDFPLPASSKKRKREPDSD